MKIWFGYGSEHSANLVMIGHFESSEEALKTKQIMDQIEKQVRADEAQTHERGVARRTRDRYSDQILNLLVELNVGSIGPEELEQFIYEAHFKVENSDLIITTNELDVSSFLKVMITRGAKVEIYSAHDFSSSKYGRGKRGD